MTSFTDVPEHYIRDFLAAHNLPVATDVTLMYNIVYENSRYLLHTTGRIGFQSIHDWFIAEGIQSDELYPADKILTLPDDTLKLFAVALNVTDLSRERLLQILRYKHLVTDTVAPRPPTVILGNSKQRPEWPPGTILVYAHHPGRGVHNTFLRVLKPIGKKKLGVEYLPTIKGTVTWNPCGPNTAVTPDLTKIIGTGALTWYDNKKFRGYLLERRDCGNVSCVLLDEYDPSKSYYDEVCTD